MVTYAITGAPGSGVIGINGAAAHLISPGNLVIIMSFLQLDESERASHLAKVVHVDSANRIVALGSGLARPTSRWGSPSRNTTIAPPSPGR